MLVISDAGPLLHLTWVGALGWAFPDEPIHVVDSVAAEVERHHPAILLDPRIVRVDDPVSDWPELSRWALHPGELAALCFALEQETSDLVFVCDEKAARSAGIALGLAVTGSLGLLADAVASGRATAETAIDALERLPTEGRCRLAPEVLTQSRKRIIALANQYSGDG